MMEQNATRLGRQAPKPYPQPDGTRKSWWNRILEDQGDKPRNPTRNRTEPGNDDGTECRTSKEKEPGILMEENVQRLVRQAPEPYPEPEGTRKSWWNRRPKGSGDKPGTLPGSKIMMEQNVGRLGSPGTLPKTRWNQEMMMEQHARRLERQAPEPYPETRKSRWKTVSWKNWEPQSAPELFGETIQPCQGVAVHVEDVCQSTLPCFAVWNLVWNLALLGPLWWHRPGRRDPSLGHHLGMGGGLRQPVCRRVVAWRRLRND